MAIARREGGKAGTDGERREHGRNEYAGKRPSCFGVKSRRIGRKENQRLYSLYRDRRRTV